MEEKVVPDYILKVNKLNLWIGKKGETIHLLEDISFTINKGQSLALLGDSGSGKSLTVLSILQLLPSYLSKNYTGEVFFSSENKVLSLLDLSENEWTRVRGGKIAMIFQDPMNALNPIQRCGNQILESVRIHQQLNRTDGKIRTLDLLRRVGFEDVDRIFIAYPHELSGGQLQRILIGIALAGNPDLLIADEPTTNLDANSKEEILQLLERLKKEDGISLLYITHDFGEASRMTEKIVGLENGEVVEHKQLHRLVRSNEKQHSALSRGTDHAVLLGISGLKKSFNQPGKFFGKKKLPLLVLNNIDLKLYKGQVTGLVGGSGSGKTTLGRVLLNLEKADSGKVLYKGKNLLKLDKTEDRAIRQKLQIVYQNPYNTLNPRMKIINIVQEPLDVHQPYVLAQARRKAAIEILVRVGIGQERHNSYMYQLSGGQRQRVAIARALILKPEFIVLDECVSSLDVRTQDKILNLLLELKKDFDLSYLFISHDIETVKSISEKIYCINNGKLSEVK